VGAWIAREEGGMSGCGRGEGLIEPGTRQDESGSGSGVSGWGSAKWSL
jgi:hypothetical protein